MDFSFRLHSNLCLQSRLEIEVVTKVHLTVTVGGTEPTLMLSQGKLLLWVEQWLSSA